MTAPAAPPPSPPPRHFGHGALATRLAFEVFDSLKPDAERSSLLNPRAQDADRPGRLGPALVVGVFGEWGAGKSFLLSEVGERLRQLRDPRQAALLQQQDAATGQPAPPLELTVLVEFNAWRYEREPHLLIPLLKVAEQALREEVERSIPAKTRAHERFNDQVLLFGDLIKGIYTHGGREALQLLLSANGAALTLPELKPDAGKSAEPGLLAKWESRKKALAEARRLKTPIATLESLYFNFFDYLKAITGRNPAFLASTRKRLNQQGAGPVARLLHLIDQALRWVGYGTVRPDSPLRINLVFLVDDLDRCLPEKAIEVLEAVKLFLDVEGCAFVLALDEEVVERGIAHRYQAYTSGAPGQTPITGAEYLEKLIHLPIRLPRPTGAEAQHYLAQHWPDWYAERAAAPAGSAGPAGSAASATSATSAPPAGTPAAAPVPPPLPEPNALAELVATITPPVPRKLQRVTSLLQINQALAGQLEGQGGTPLTAADQRRWLAMMCALQLFAPALFRFLRVQGGWLLQELVTWRSDLRLNNLDRLRQELRNATRKLNKPWELRDAYARERLPELVQAALLNRSGFSLLTWLEQAQRLISEARPSDTSLQRLLALAVADVGSGPTPLASPAPAPMASPAAAPEPASPPAAAVPAPASQPATAQVPAPTEPPDEEPSAAPASDTGEAPLQDLPEEPPEEPSTEPEPVPLEDATVLLADTSEEPRLVLATATDAELTADLSAAPSSPAQAPVPAPPPTPARWSPPVVERARLDNEFALWEPLAAGDAAAIERAISREGAALAGRYLPERVVEMLVQAAREPGHWLGQPLKANDARPRLIDPLLTQFDVLRLAAAAAHELLSTFRRPSWGQVRQFTIAGRDGMARYSIPVPWWDAEGQALEVVLDTRDARVPSLVGRRAWVADEIAGDLLSNGRWTLGADGEFGLYLDLTLNDTTQRFRWMEPGGFLMGSPEGQGDPIERPQHGVALTNGFWFADTPCTQAVWTATMGENLSRFHAGNDSLQRPVEQVSWDDVQDFLRVLNEWLPPGWQVDLPTEAQWEYGARAGTLSEYWWGDLPSDEHANWGKQRGGTTGVHHFPPNPWGLHDIHGNVEEWCRDGLREYSSLSGRAEIDPTGATFDGARRVVRGGSWFDSRVRARSAFRYLVDPGSRRDTRGFRLVLIPPNRGTGSHK